MAEAVQYIIYGDRLYKHGDLLVKMHISVNGFRERTVTFFLVLHDEEQDCLRLEPVSWRVAHHCFKDQLNAALKETR